MRKSFHDKSMLAWLITFSFLKQQFALLWGLYNYVLLYIFRYNFLFPVQPSQNQSSSLDHVIQTSFLRQQKNVSINLVLFCLGNNLFLEIVLVFDTQLVLFFRSFWK